MRAELLGVRVRGPFPWLDVEVPLTGGLNALVGLNGAGKSGLLRSIGAALSGKGLDGWETHTLVRIVEGDPDPRTEHLIPVVRDAEDGLDRLTATTWTAAVAELLSSDDLARSVLAPVRLPGPPPRPQVEMEIWRGERERIMGPLVSNEELVAEVTQNHLVAWVQVGKRDPLACIAVPARPDDPATRVLLEAHEDDFDTVVEYSLSQLAEDGEVHAAEYLWYDGARLDWSEGDISPWRGDRLPVPICVIPGAQRTGTARVLVEDAVSGEADTLLPQLYPLLTMQGHLTVAALRYLEEVMPEDDQWKLDDLWPEWVRWPPDAFVLFAAWANGVYVSLVDDPPELRVALAPLQHWLSGPAARWEAQDRPSGQWVALSALSASQQRWARLAIGTGPNTQGWGFAVFDEPEAGIHRAAEAHLASGLARVGELGTITIVATHSPAMAIEAHNLIEVSRTQSGAVTARQVADSLPERAAGLGLLPTDILAWYRVVVLVEGHHDKVIVSRLLADELRISRALLLQLGGVRGSSAGPLADFLSRLTHLRFVVLVDAAGAATEKEWSQILDASVPDQRQMLDHLGKEGIERQFLRDLGHDLLAQGRLGAVAVQCLDVPDVVDLLPPGPFVPGMTWEQVRARHQQAPKKTRGEFKAWVSSEYGTNFSDRRLHEAMDELDHLPDSLARLSERLMRLSDEARWNRLQSRAEAGEA